MTTRHGLVGSYLASARAKEALAAYKRVAADRERVLRPDHLDTPRRGTTSAPPPRRRARRRVRSCLRAGLGRVRAGARPRHPDALLSRASLAQVYSRLGRYGDIRALLRDTVHRLERTLPEGDPLIIELRQSLAGIGEE
jgi:hypothetical protein